MLNDTGLQELKERHCEGQVEVFGEHVVDNHRVKTVENRSQS